MVNSIWEARRPMTDRLEPRTSGHVQIALHAPSGLPLDDIDRQILRILQAGKRASIQSIADEIQMSHSGAMTRLRRLEESGVILRYLAEIDDSIFARWPAYWVDVRLAPRGRRDRTSVDAALARVPEIIDASVMVGKYDLRLRVALQSPGDWPVVMTRLDPHADLLERTSLPAPVGEMRKRSAPHPLLLNAGD
jgi:Lrp/AsnC family leucine-responsive transcriptional regulator